MTTKNERKSAILPESADEKSTRLIDRMRRADHGMTDAELIAAIEWFMFSPPWHPIIVPFTPGVCKWIEGTLKIDNRRLRREAIGEFSDYLKQGNWYLTGQAILFSDRPRLLDGQHRVIAAAQTGIGFLAFAYFGVPDGYFLWLDRGRPRNADDALHTQNVANSQDKSKALVWLERFRRDNVKGRNTIRPYEIAKAYNDLYDIARLEEAVSWGAKIYKADGTPRSVAAALFYLFTERDRLLAEAFYNAWMTNFHGGRMAPIKKAAEFIKKVQSDGQTRINDTTRVALWVIAWNLVVTRKKGSAKDFRWKLEMPFPEIMG